jgi:hypothetical protein
METIVVALLTALFTAGFGLLSYIAGQIILKLIEPILELRALIGIIAGDECCHITIHVPLDSYPD